MALTKPPVPRPFEPPIEKKRGTDVVTKRELPKWMRWETYGQCSHDAECRPKMMVASAVAVVALLVLVGWIGGGGKRALKEEGWED